MAATVKREQGGQMPDVHDLSSLLDTLAENTDGDEVTVRQLMDAVLADVQADNLINDSREPEGDGEAEEEEDQHHELDHAGPVEEAGDLARGLEDHPGGRHVAQRPLDELAVGDG